MKTPFYTWLCVLILLLQSTAVEAVPSPEPLTLPDLQAVTNFLSSFDVDKNKLIDLRDNSESPLRNKIIAYYKTSTNTLSLEHRFVVATCMLAEIQDLSTAVKIAEEFVAVNPTNAAGWVLLGSTSMGTKDFSRCIEAYEKAITFGRTNVVAALCMVAFQTEKLDIIQKNLPRLLAILQDPNSERFLRQDVLGVTVGYAIRSENKAIFLKIVKDLDMRLLRDRRDLLILLDKACKHFDSDERVCARISKALKDDWATEE